MVEISVFAPIFNEEGNIIRLYQELYPVLEEITSNWELILVNDGSTDKSLAEMLALKDKRVVVIDLQRNYKQAIAMDAGFRASKGKYIVSIDADLQNDPKDIPRLLTKLKDENLDVVAGWRYKRKDPLWVRFVTKTARVLRGLFASDGVHDSGCTLRVYRREFVQDLELWGEMHRYIMAILQMRGARIGELKVNHRSRGAGVSKYKWTKSLKGFVDLFYIWFWKKYSNRPQHLFGVMGVFFLFFGFFSGAVTLILKIFFDLDVSDSSWIVLTIFFILMGLQFFISGVMLDILVRNYYHTSREKRYVVRTQYKNGKECVKSEEE